MTDSSYISYFPICEFVCKLMKETYSFILHVVDWVVHLTCYNVKPAVIKNQNNVTGYKMIFICSLLIPAHHQNEICCSVMLHLLKSQGYPLTQNTHCQPHIHLHT